MNWQQGNQSSNYVVLYFEGMISNMDAEIEIIDAASLECLSKSNSRWIKCRFDLDGAGKVEI